MEKSELSLAFLKETERRIFDESYQRIYKCLDLLTEEELWQRPNSQLSSIGNLVLHLVGNARQWFLSGLGEVADQRKRDDEFSADSKCDKAELIRKMEVLKTEVRSVLSKITQENLLRKRKVQVFEETGLSILVHVIEHFSYHTGQITWYTKFLKNEDLMFYGNLNV